jgi:lysophospholipase L1-like esterase
MKLRAIVATGFIVALCLPAQALAVSIAGLGDSLTRAYGATGSPGDDPVASWSTGSDPGVDSHASRLSARGLGGGVGNYAISGSTMSATDIEAAKAIDQHASYVTVLAGTNDVCTPTIGEMTSVSDYSTQLRTTLTDLTTGLPGVRILVVSIPNWYGLWQQYHTTSAAVSAWTTYARCPDLLGSGATDADRTVVQQRISALNAADASVCGEFPTCTYDGGAAFGLSYAIADLTFDYFHLSPGGQGLLAAATWAVSPFAYYDGFVTDPLTNPGCLNGCSVSVNSSGVVTATIAGGADNVDTAYALKNFGGASGLAGRVYVRDVLGLGSGQVLHANLSVFQVRDSSGNLVYELYVAPDRTLRLWSPPGGLRGSSINQSTGSIVPNDGSSIRVQVSAQANNSLIVRVDGTDKITITGLSGATTGNQDTLRAGIDHYDTTSSNETVRAIHSEVTTSQSSWPDGGGGTSPPVNNGLPTISGTAQQGQTLTASNGSWTNNPTSYSYQWRRCDSSGSSCADIGTATTNTYTPTNTDVGSTLRIDVTASNAGGPSTNPAESNQTAVVTASSSTPTTFGATAPGSSTASPGSGWKFGSPYPLSSAATATAFEFYASGGPAAQTFTPAIYSSTGSAPGTLLATGSTVTVQANQAAGWVTVPLPATPLNPGTYYLVLVTGPTSNNANFYYTPGGPNDGVYNPNTPGTPTPTFGTPSTEPRLWSFRVDLDSGSTPPPPVNNGLPTISGTAQQGQTLTASNGSWTNNPTSYSYQWRRCDSSGSSCADIGTATTNTYTPTNTDVGSTLRIDVTASNAGGPSTNPAESNQTAVVTASSSTPTTFGATAPGSSTASPGSGWKFGSPYPLSSAATATAFEFYASGGPAAQTFTPAIYSSTGSAPGTLLATGSTVTVQANQAAGWVTVPLPATPLNPGTYYLVLVTGPTSNNANFYYTPGGPNDGVYNPNTPGTPTPTFGTPSTEPRLYSLRVDISP